MTTRLIFNADDLGLAAPVNAAIEQAHREGVLTAASLMVGEPAAAEGVEVARRNPRLAIGLHLTLTDGTPTLPPERIPALVQPNGRFRDDMAGLGLTLAISAAARTQLRAEIAAQCAAFRATGLACDHLNAHKHYHLHPVIAVQAFAEAARQGIRAVRIPHEPGTARALAPLILWLRRLAVRHGLRAPDRVIGLAWTGAFTAERLAEALARLPPGVTELYFHPAMAGGFPGAAPGYRYPEELAALTDPRIRAACATLPSGGYTAMLA
ncbi:hopanoid biosynthesis-associated protein HpnK [Belnapia rosea]|uniref:Hopanoid biosynthesis associated protein HpnK n=1 Tax=Belnapia rosea TaxID=938405 RepID=A0A1G6SKJ5_9PROT|nr:hopanoid biosynthesis-associated protein HpnK [Belnapia rosea]SDB61476.1 hopanoid biosynthesis associated protein HpnK [Belnapia rosea]SDD17204.1 hopanoid biosynthesis associated protein HpnK [Belnapia rosea]